MTIGFLFLIEKYRKLELNLLVENFLKDIEKKQDLQQGDNNSFQVIVKTL